MRKTWRILIAIFIMVPLLLSPPPQLGCIDFEGAVFSYSRHPDFPLDRFAQGELGILQPTYARSYLFVAYRYLIGAGFDETEQKALLALWNERLFGDWPLQEWDASGTDWVKNWLRARGRVPDIGPPPEIKVYPPAWSTSYGPVSYLNCPQDAFRTAVTTLNQRIKQFGLKSPEVKAWVRTQDQVFAGCSGAKSIPTAAGSGVHSVIRADRAYQIAAAHFYAGNFDVAKKRFEEIANDRSSPWRQVAPYLTARTLVRQATLNAGPADFDVDTLTQAEHQLKKLLNDPGLRPVHPAAQRLLNLVRLRLYPEVRVRELARALLRKASGRSLKQNLWDYTVLLDHLLDEKPYDEREKTSERIPRVGREDDLTDWVLTFQVKDAAALNHTLQRWRQTSSLPWLVASLTKVNARHPRLPELLRAAEKVSQDSPAFPSVAFHRLRLMMESGRTDEARDKLEALLSHSLPTWPPSTRNLFLAESMKLARDLEEFLTYAPRSLAGITYGLDSRELPLALTDNIDKRLAPFIDGRACFGADAAGAFNERMPLGLLKDAVTRSVLPEPLRRDLTIAAWTRAVLLENEEISREIVPVLESLAPELKPFLDDYLSAGDLAARRFAAVFLMLKYPGMRPFVSAGFGRVAPLELLNIYRDNWWCPFRPSYEFRWRPWISEPLLSLYPAGSIGFPEFLDDTQKATTQQEWNTLSTIPTGPNYLARQVVEYAKGHPDDPRVPEALHLAVRATRYGCTDEATGRFSKAAFQLLHRRYPSSPWAKKTKYWFR